MGKMKLYELAKELEVASKDLLNKANEIGIQVKSHLSSLEDEDIEKLRQNVLKGSLHENDQATKKDNKKTKQEENKVAKKEEKKVKQEEKKETKKDDKNTPVIIRREVIIEEKKKEEEKRKEKAEKLNTVVRRNDRKDFNIVYRNKPEKPLTVSELFGLGTKKEETKKTEEIAKEKMNNKIENKLDKEQKENIIENDNSETNYNRINQNEIDKDKYISNKTEESDNKIKEQNKEFENIGNFEDKTYINNQGNKDSNYINSDKQGNKNYNDKKLDRQNNRNFDNRNKERQNNRNYEDRNDGQNNRNYEDRRDWQNSRNYEDRRDRQGNRNYEDRRDRQSNKNYEDRRDRQNNRNYDDKNRDRQNNRNYDDRNRDRQINRNYDERNKDRQNGKGYDERDKQNNFRDKNGFRDRKNNYRDNQNGDRRQGRRTLDEKGIEKNIKDIMSSDVVEKESREYNKAIDKQKNNNKFDENRNNKKKTSRKNKKEDINEGKLKNLKQHDKLSNMFEDSSEGSMLDYYDLTTQRGRKGKKKNIKDEERTKQKIFKLQEITIPEAISVKDLATELKKTSSEIIMKLMGLGIMATLNNELDFDTAFLVAEEFGVNAIKKQEVKEEDILFDDSEDLEEELAERPPVVVVMGHVDHGKTSLLDAVRKTNVIEGEAGGITQAIGAYKVKINDREITFLDTPGHEAFTAMRARGAQITDIAILVVAANDGVMPQTVEAINHAKSANIPIIVAINKIDLPDSNPQKVKEELMQYELVPEEWGGDTIYVEISAKKNLNIDQLLEMVLLQADVLELKANPNKQAKGVVIEARLDKNKGAIASMLVQRGSLDVGDTVVVGSTIGRIRSMTNDKGKKVKSAGPSTPVEIMGLTEVPQAGDIFYEVKDEKMAKHLIERRKMQEREKSINSVEAVTLDNLFSQMEKGSLKQLNLIVKADVQGSVEALKQSLEKLSNDEVKVKVIHSAAGAVTESDITLAKVSNAIIIAFNVRPVATAKQEAEENEIQIKQYSVIYNAIEDVEAAMKGMLDPKFEEELIGTAEVRKVYKISNVGTIAGCMVTSGKIERNAGVRVIRDDVVIHEGKLISLKRFKEDAKEVAKDFECGIQIEKYNDIQEKDIIEAFIMKEIKR